MTENAHRNKNWRCWAALLVALPIVCMAAACPFEFPLPHAGDNGVGGHGDASAGQALYSQACVACHSSAASLAGVANLITMNMGTVNPAMSGITLTTQQVADLQAYLVSLSASGRNNGGSRGGASAGQTLYTQMCVACHPSAASLAGVANLITMNMGAVNPAMSGITLTTQQVADLQAYLASLSPGGGNNGGSRGGASAGQTLFTQMCIACHPSAASLAGVANLIIMNMGAVNPAMSGITLTTQQVADLQAYLASLSPGAGGINGGSTGGASAGQTLYTQMCIACHPSATSLAGAASRITTNMGTVDPAMSGITLTTQQVADLQAYLVSLPSGGNSGGDDGYDDD